MLWWSPLRSCSQYSSRIIDSSNGEGRNSIRRTSPRWSAGRSCQGRPRHSRKHHGVHNGGPTGQPGQQIQTNQLRNTNVQINANESIQNVDLFFLPSVLGDCCEPIASWVCRKFHTQNVVCVWLDPSIVMMACSITQYVYNIGATTSRYHVSFVHKGTSTS